jgi:hypothetical protein
VHEDVTPAAFGLNEAKAFLNVEEFHGSGSHVRFPSEYRHTPAGRISFALGLR